MNVKTNRNMGRVLLAGACAAALTVGSAAPAFAAPQSGTTSVTYSSSQQIPGTNGWGFEVPTAIPFGSDKAVTVDASVNLYNTVPGGSVDQITTLPIGGAKLYVKSTNGFTLNKTGDVDPVAYQIVYQQIGEKAGGGAIDPVTLNAATGKTKTLIGTFDKKQDSPAKADSSRAAGTASRLADAKESGAHSDTLTFSYDDETGA